MIRFTALTAACVATSFTLALGASSASAALLIEDGFAAGGTSPGTGEYQSDPASTNGTNNDSIAGQSPDLTGWDNADAWSDGGGFRDDLYGQIADTGLTYTDANNNVLDTTAGHLRFLREINASVTRSTSRDTTLNGPMTNHTPQTTGVYIAQLIRFDSVGTTGSVDFVQGGSRSLGLSIDSNGHLLVGSHNTFDPPPKDMGALAAGETHLIITRFFESNQFEVWVNPTDLSDSSSPDFSGGDPGPGYVGSNNSYGLEQATIDFPGGSAGESFEVDELRVATSFSEAVPFTAIPEPASAVLIGLGGVLMLTRRRRASC